MKKPIIRQLKKMKGSNELVVCVSPEIRDAIGSAEGDNLLLEVNPDSGIVEMSKVVQSPNRQQNETRENAEDETRENKSRVGLADKEEQSQQDKVSRFEFCASCGSDDIQVTGNQFYCGDCDVTYEVTSRGTKVVATNPFKNVDDLENRVGQLERDIDKLNNNPSKDKNSGGFLSRFFGFADDGDDEDDISNQGFIRFESDEDEDLVPVGADADEDEDEPRGFISW